MSDDCFGATNVGLVRDHNEDAFFGSRECRLFVVADGLGGHEAGEVASALAVDAVRQTMMISTDGNLNEERDLAELLREAFAQADARIRAHVAIHPECDGMGATLIIAAVQGDSTVIAHAGDVRAYRFGNNTLTRLTQDHSTVAQLVREGLLSKAQAAVHPLRSQIYQAVGGDRPSRPDIGWHDIAAGEFLLLCSDGLWDELSDEDIVGVLERGGTAEQLVAVLVDLANAAGGRDKITAVLYCHRGEQ